MWSNLSTPDPLIQNIVIESTTSDKFLEPNNNPLFVWFKNTQPFFCEGTCLFIPTTDPSLASKFSNSTNP